MTLIQELNAYNKNLRRQYRHDEQMTLKEYTDWKLMGKRRKSKRVISTKSLKSSNVYRRETQYIASKPDTVGVAAQRQSVKYTGALIKGIATMHKSNAVPVISEEQATDIAKMRRG